MKTIDLRRAAREAADLPTDEQETVLLPGLRPSAVLARAGLEPTGAAAPRPGDREVALGRFQVLGELGRGGMGRVLEARDPELDRIVAIKVIAGSRELDPEQLAAFVAEARLTAQLQHPGIVPVHEMGVTRDGRLYFVMKKVEGVSLGQLLAALREEEPEACARWSRHRLLTVFVQVCQAVAFAHSRGVLHRDLKPSNVMLGAFAEVQVMDWGLARRSGGTADSEELACGTPGYMSPEQARGEADSLDRRSDVWSLGAILYELLTLRRAIDAPTVPAMIYRTLEGPPEDPRLRAPDRRVPEEIAAICVRALQPAPADRHADAEALATAVEAFLEGARRRRVAAGHLATARQERERYLALERERAELELELVRARAAVEPWTPLEEKADLLLAEERLEAIGPERARAFAGIEAAAEHALAADPGNPEARALLAEAWLDRLVAAEEAGDAEGAGYARDRAASYDDGPLVAVLKGTGGIRLDTEPSGAQVLCRRVERIGLVWRAGPQRELGRTPLRVPLAMGSWLLTLRLPGRQDTTYPVLIGRGALFDAGAPVPLLEDRAIDPDFVYVPGGPFVFGGDPGAADAGPRRLIDLPGFLIARFPVTVAEYAEFLTELRAEGRDDEAWTRVPRQESGVEGGGGQYWVRPVQGAAYAPPERDRDGDRWDPRWPVLGISWHDAVAYVDWRSRRDRLPSTLPSEHEREKAGRGVDGRAYPWGDRFDATLCKMRNSRPGASRPEPVGAFPHDVSVYGVRDVAGSARDWCRELSYDGDPTRRPARGGSWNGAPAVCRLAHRVGLEPHYVATNSSIRLVRPLPG